MNKAEKFLLVVEGSVTHEERTLLALQKIQSWMAKRLVELSSFQKEAEESGETEFVMIVKKEIALGISSFENLTESIASLMGDINEANTMLLEVLSESKRQD